MRLASAGIVALLAAMALSGCSSKDGGDGDDGPAVPVQAPEAFDRLSDRLAAGSGEAQDFAVEEDRVHAPLGGSMAFVTGRGMHCSGDLDAVAPNATGWVVCSVRLAASPEAEARGVHALGVGEDTQRLTLRMAAEPVEWRVVVTVLAGEAELVPFDSGWRPVDLSPRLSNLTMTFETTDACDVLDAHESQLAARRGETVLRLAFAVEHGQSNLTLDVGRSVPVKADGAESSQRFLPHGYEAGFNAAGSRLVFRVNVTVDLEAAEPPGAAAPSSDGPCAPEPTLAQETQHWTATVTIRGADGQSKPAQIAVDVPVGLAP